jgi:hypothetical protein
MAPDLIRQRASLSRRHITPMLRMTSDELSILKGQKRLQFEDLLLVMRIGFLSNFLIWQNGTYQKVVSLRQLSIKSVNKRHVVRDLGIDKFHFVDINSGVGTGPGWIGQGTASATGRRKGVHGEDGVSGLNMTNFMRQ